MGCSSYCDFVIKLKNRKKIQWSGEDGFNPIFFIPDHTEARLNAVKSIEDLIAFVHACIAGDGMSAEDAAKLYQRKCGKFNEQLRSIGGFDEVTGLAFSWGQYYPEDGSPEEACTGQSLDYDFKTGKLKLQRGPTADFIEEMFDVYGDMLDFD